MKNILTAFFISAGLATTFLAAPHPATAQTTAAPSTDQRTTTTRIADLLARMPATNKEDLETNLQNTTALGEDGLTEMALMLTAPGAGDNTRVEYALTGYSYYTTKTGNETLRTAATRAYGKALGKTADPECKAYLIRQLEITGSDEAIPYLRSYLADQRLSDPAARALVKINSRASARTLFEALPNASGKTRAILVQALGDIRYTAGAGSLNKLAKSLTSPGAAAKDPALTKAVYYALGRIGDPSSETVLANAAAAAAFQYDVAGATLAYIDYIRRLAVTGNTTRAGKAARSLLVNTSTASSLPAHTAALRLLVEIEGEKSLPSLLIAVDDKDASYREAALKYALLLPGDASASEWTKKLKASKDASVKAAIITMLGYSRQTTTLPAVQSFLEDKNDSIRIGSIRAAGLIGQEQALPSLLEVLKNGQPADIAEVKRALLIMKGSGVTDAVAAALPSVSGPAKAALVDVLAARAADSHINGY
jgi:HEAT repeat protein